MIEEVNAIGFTHFLCFVALFEVCFVELVAVVKLIHGFEDVTIFGNESLIIDLNFILFPNLLLQTINVFWGFNKVGVPALSKAQFDQQSIFLHLR